LVLLSFNDPRAKSAVHRANDIRKGTSKTLQKKELYFHDKKMHNHFVLEEVADRLPGRCHIDFFLVPRHTLIVNAVE